MSPLHINLELMLDFVKTMSRQSSNGFEFLFKKFFKLSPAKLKEGIFVGPQIWENFEDLELEKAVNILEICACLASIWI